LSEYVVEMLWGKDRSAQQFESALRNYEISHNSQVRANKRLGAAEV